MIHPYGNPARDEVEDHQQGAEASYYTARSALHHGDLRRAVTNQQRARLDVDLLDDSMTEHLEAT